MEKYIEVTGKTEDAAIAAGLKQLGLERDDISVEILERAKTGFLGIGSSPARVKLTYQAPDEPEVVIEAAPAVEEVKETPAPEAPAAVAVAGLRIGADDQIADGVLAILFSKNDVQSVFETDWRPFFSFFLKRR